MTERLEGVVLNTLHHNDTHDIVTLYTLERGRLACLRRRPAPGSKAARAASAATAAPLSIVELQMRFNPARELQTFSQIAPLRLWHRIMADPEKCIMALFISDLLTNLLRAAEPDPNLYAYIIEGISSLDATRRPIANFHIAFICGLLPLLGIQPDTRECTEESWLDMREGKFTRWAPPHNDRLEPRLASRIPLLERMNFRNMHLYKMSVSLRREALESLLRYCAVHIPFNPQLKSLDILRQWCEPLHPCPQL